MYDIFSLGLYLVMIIFFGKDLKAAIEQNKLLKRNNELREESNKKYDKILIKQKIMIENDKEISEILTNTDKLEEEFLRRFALKLKEALEKNKL